MRFNTKKAIALILAASFLCSFFIFSTSTFAASPKISAELTKKAAHNPNSVIPVIVQTQRGYKAKHKTLVENLSGTIKHDLPLIKGFSAGLPAAALEELAKDEEITRISYDSEVHTCLDTATAADDRGTVEALDDVIAEFSSRGSTLTV